MILVLCDGRVEVTARVDLAVVSAPQGLVDLVGRLFSRFPDAEAWFLAYTDDEPFAWAVLARCAALCGVMRLGRVIQVGSARWRADDPDGESGTVGVSATAVEAAVLGLPLRRSRAELEALVAGPEDSKMADLSDVFARVSTELEELSPGPRHRLLHRLLADGGERFGVEDWVRLAVLVAEPWAAVDILNGVRKQGAENQVALWTQVVRHCLPPYASVPLGLLGVAAWLTGDGAMETICLERLDRIDPANPMAALPGWINSEVLPPSAWPIRRRELVAAVAEWFKARVPV